MNKLYHYKECGLDNIYLLNGVERIDTPYGHGTKIQNMKELHTMIGHSICKDAHPLTPKEFRYLRVEMGLSQKNLGSFMTVKDQTVARWEKGTSQIPGSADKLMRMLYLEHIKENSSLRDICEELSEIDNTEQRAKKRKFVVEDGWQVAA